MENKGITQNALANMIDTKSGYLSELLANKKRWNTDKIEDVLEALNVEMSDILPKKENLEVKYIKVIAAVQAGVWKEAVQWHEDDCYTAKIALPNDYAKKNYFGLLVEGDSMDKEFGPGSILTVCPVYEYDDEVKSGHFVIVQRTMNGITEATAKQLEIIDGHAKLWPRSNNPKYQEPIEITWPYEDPQECGLETVEITGIVVSATKVY